jgi:hypothetical protein
MVELGLDTFGDVVYDGNDRPVTQAQALRNVVAEGVLADKLGIDAFGVGEHHRADFSISAPEVILAAIAGQTERILLGSAVTVLSTDDPVRVFQRFLSALRLRPFRLQRAVRRETGSVRQVTRRASRYLVGSHAESADQSDDLSAG